MVLILSAVVPWAFRDSKAFQGVDQEAGEARCSLAVALGPSFLSHLKKRYGEKLAQLFEVHKGVDDFYSWHQDGVQLHGYMIIIKGSSLETTPIMGILPQS